MAKRKKTERAGTKLAYNASQQAKYARAIKALVDKMAKVTKREILKLFKQPFAKEFFATDADIASQARILLNKLTDRFTSLFASSAKRLAEAAAEGAQKTSEKALKSSVKALVPDLSLKTSIVTPDLETSINASVTENVNLIKSIPDQYYKDVTGVVMRAIQFGQGAKDIAEHLEKTHGISNRRATLIAYDQTRKIYSTVNRERMQALGIKKFRWLHSAGGQTPRPLHVKYNMQVFSFDDPPVIDEKTGERGFPGQLVNCRCTFAPVIDFGDEDNE